MANKLEQEDALFVNLVLIFQNAAMQQMGKVTNPMTGKIEKNLEQARFSIDMIDMLRSKTRGNISSELEKLLDTALTNLRMNYVDEANKAPSEGGEEKAETPEGKEAADTAGGQDQETAAGGGKSGARPASTGREGDAPHEDDEAAGAKDGVPKAGGSGAESGEGADPTADTGGKEASEA